MELEGVLETSLNQDCIFSERYALTCTEGAVEDSHSEILSYVVHKYKINLLGLKIF